MEVAILMSVFNRKEKTLACLVSCRSQIESMKSDGRYTFSVYMTEDACTDGTAEAVAGLFPQVHIIHGNGSLYWNRGMAAAWEAAAASSPDYYLWINDDIILRDGAFQTLLEISSALRDQAIVTGTTEDSAGQISYGGRTRKGRIVPPDATIPVGCDTFNGNLVLVPKYVYGKIGGLDTFYSHSFGDYDYGIRAAKKGIVSVVAPGILATCDRNRDLPVWKDGSYSLKERYASLMSPKGRPLKEQFVYDMRSEGLPMAVAHFVTLNLRVIFPLMKSV